MNKIMLVVLLLTSVDALAAREWPLGKNVSTLGFSTADYSNARKCIYFTDQNNVTYYYSHNDDPVRMSNANAILSILMFAKGTSATVALITDDAEDGACGSRKILNIWSE